jgi:hypothetical protein
MAARPIYLILLLAASCPALAQQLHRCPTKDGSTYLSNLPCPPREAGVSPDAQKARDEAVVRSLQDKRQAETAFQARSRARAIIRQQWAEQAAERRRLSRPAPHTDWQVQVDDFLLLMGKERIEISRPELEALLREEAAARR